MRQLKASGVRRQGLVAEKFVCYDAMLEIVCSDQHIVIFDQARYGRNNSQVIGLYDAQPHR